MTDTAHSQVRADLLAAIRASTVAAAAGVSPTVWADTVRPRVMAGDSNYISGLHRGRLPAVEVFEANEDWSNDYFDGGMLTMTWGIRVHVGGFSQADAELQARLIMAYALASIRSNLRLKWGAEKVSPLRSTALGHALEAVISIIVRADRSTFETASGAASFLLLNGGGHLSLNGGGSLLLH